jgi:hypothetical protein
MDTNIADRLEIQVDDGGEALPHTNDALGEDRLRAFRTIETGERPTAGSQAPSPVKKGRRNGLMIGGCSVAVLATAAGTFWISPYNDYTLHDATNLATHVRNLALNTAPRPAPLVAPAAQLARAPEPTQAPLRYRPGPPASQAIAGDDMAEFLRLGGQGAPPLPAVVPPSSPAVATSPAAAKPDQVALAAPAVSEALKPAGAPQQASTTGMKALPPATHSADPMTPVVEAGKPALPATPTAATAAPKPAPSVPAAPQDAVAKIAELRPAPMTDPQQVQVLQLVTELGTLVRDQRAEIAQLRQDQQNLDQRVDGSLTDFGRRLSLAEARGAVNAAMGVQTAPAQAALAATMPVNAVATPVAVKTPLPAAAPADTTPPRYHVQAASPGLAMLSVLDASGGEEQQLPVSPGDSVPGWGKVISISQRGATWVVKTDHGLIL